ncbi:hypothetical protein F5B22DRAFT_639458 [Xylaria bambusicola]|uniref:uncharacterized protein n=1 Tax=Xylaria bambusicola TaxID=326684 RepID=UPI002008837A|nr:uncharacterized protein F5B22DRAFT_639458 [Xylaria bambusicola]KAI0506139.1 hypothetical protein F5B22DRAFT_639458 [Xylaria bambusicola]
MSAQPATTTIELTQKEDQLKDLLLDTAKYVNNSQPSAQPVILRWAGGWVRDKLLGIESHDIDTAVNTMTGEAFALKICELCEKPEIAEKHRITSADIGSLHKIAKNPDKSKHLETTTIMLFGFDVDFVNLRKETYTEDSRNPQMEFGTAEEDALRRDATVNALFYNLNTGRVEDFTSGLKDMKAKLIKTPLEPFQTFMDDPLRVLRLIRFASRLGFTIDRAAEECMSDVKVLEALKLKISRERVGVEIEKMLKGNDPRRALQYINDLGLYHTIFTDPSKSSMPLPDLSRWHTVYECLSYLSSNEAHESISTALVQTEEASYYAWTLAALAPWELADEPKRNGKGKPPPPLITLAAREGIKAPNRLCDVVTAAHKNKADILALKTAVVQKESCINERDRFGMAIRHWDARGGYWQLQVLFSLLVEAMQRWEASSTSSKNNDNFLGEWQLFIDHLRELDVMDAPSMKKLIDGTQLAKALGVKPGKWMMGALEFCVAWQLRHPNATDPSGAVEEVNKRRNELDIPPS